MRDKLLFVLFVLFTLGGCGQREESSAAPGPVAAPAQTQAEPARMAAAEQARRSIAYEHTVSLDVREDRVAALFETARQTCADDLVNECVVLEASLRTGEYLSATIRMRAKPTGVRKLMAVMGSQGTITTQSTMAEDLAAPLEDSARKLAMLQDYREKLEALRQLASRDIDALIKINKELAQAQTDIEARTGERAHLVRRVETEVLRINIDSRRSRSFLTPIARAAADFTTDLSIGMAGVITALAYLVPWGLALLALAWAVAKLWRRWRRRRPGG